MQESLGLKFDKFISVDARSVQVSEKIGKLSTLLITKRHDSITTPKWAVYSREEQDTLPSVYGMASVYSFARNYFSFQNRVGDLPDKLHIYTWAQDKEQAPALVGGRTPSLDDLKKLNGKVSLTIGNVTKTIALNFTGKNSHTEIATEFATAIKKDNNSVDGFKDATVAWNSVHAAFVITAGAGSKSIHFVTTPSDGTDLSGSLGLSAGEGARIVEPYAKVETLAKVLQEVAKRNDTYFYVTFDAEFTNADADLLTAAQWVHDSRGQYCLIYCSSQVSLLTQSTYTHKYHNYNGLVLEYTPNLRLTNGKSAGIFSSVDYSKPRGNLSFAYNKIDVMQGISIKDEGEYDTLTNTAKNRANGYVTARRLTKGYTWYMPGNVMGTDTTHLNVYVGNFMISQLLQQGFATWLSNNSFPSTSDSTALRLFSNSVMQQALNIGLVAPVESLDPEEFQQLSAVFNTMQAAQQSLVANGFYTEIGSYDAAARCVNIIIAYMANVPIRKLCIKLHALRG